MTSKTGIEKAGEIFSGTDESAVCMCSSKLFK